MDHPRDFRRKAGQGEADRRRADLRDARSAATMIGAGLCAILGTVATFAALYTSGAGWLVSCLFAWLAGNVFFLLPAVVITLRARSAIVVEVVEVE